MMEPDDTVDLVLTNGRVIDPETGVDGLRHVGIRGGEIVSIQRATQVPRPAAQQIDASRSVIRTGVHRPAQPLRRRSTACVLKRWTG